MMIRKSNYFREVMMTIVPMNLSLKRKEKHNSIRRKNNNYIYYSLSKTINDNKVTVIISQCDAIFSGVLSSET